MSTARIASVLRITCALTIVTLLAPGSVDGQATCEPPRPVTATGMAWAGPLARVVTLNSQEMLLRHALARVAEAARLRLSYSAELLPLDRKVCARFAAAPAGDVLVELLRGTALEPVVAGADLVVLAPSRVSARPRNSEPAALPAVIPLEPVPVDAKRRNEEHTVAVDVIDGRRLAQQSAGTLAQVLNAAVPGVWLWERSGSSLFAHYGSLRGASSFGLSSPKVYIDGIEVANPLLVTRILPDAIDRIEVIRGPQGGALYGANALSGVTNIMTAQGAAESGVPRTQVRSRFGLANSDFTPDAVLAQEHTVTVQAGSPTRSAALDLAIGSSGEVVPDAFARYLSGGASGRLIGDRSLVTGTLRLSAERAGQPASPVLDDVLSGTAGAAARSVVQYTAGLTAKYLYDERWTHAFVAGFDGYSLGGYQGDPTALVSPAEAALRSAASSALRGTLRATSEARLDLGANAAGGLTFIAEHSVLRQDARAEDSPLVNGVSRSNTGLGARLNVAVSDRLVLDGGVRFEHLGGVEGVGMFATLPTLGAAFINDLGPAALTFRAAYGKAVRWPDPTASLVPADPTHALHGWRSGPALAPEQQSGTEAGFDLAFGRTFGLNVTRFDQTASGLVQDVAVATSPVYGGFEPIVQRSPGAPPPRGHYFHSVPQNVGEIENRGWELAATFAHGPLSLAGTLALVDSRVRNVAASYTGDLRPGDRMLAVPATTASLMAAWIRPAWSASLTTYRAANWINYDRIGLARALESADGSAPLPGEELRRFWRTYDGITHVQATLTRELRRGLTLMLTGDNLLDLQVGEPDNITILPGRSISLGVRASF